MNFHVLFSHTIREKSQESPLLTQYPIHTEGERIGGKFYICVYIYMHMCACVHKHTYICVYI